MDIEKGGCEVRQSPNVGLVFTNKTDPFHGPLGEKIACRPVAFMIEKALALRTPLTDSLPYVQVHELIEATSSMLVLHVKRSAKLSLL